MGATTPDDAARAAEWLYPALNNDDEELTYPRSALRQGKRDAYLRGRADERTRIAARRDEVAEALRLEVGILQTTLRDALAAGEAHKATVERVRALAEHWEGEASYIESNFLPGPNSTSAVAELYEYAGELRAALDPS